MFLNKTALKYNKNIIVIGDDVSIAISSLMYRHLNRIWTNLDEKKTTSKDFHIDLFHEMNHYRHYIKHIGTYDDKGIVYKTINEEKSSTNIRIRKNGTCFFIAKMQNSEEEL